MLIDAVVHAVNEDYDEMAGDFIKLGFLSAGTRRRPPPRLCVLALFWLPASGLACRPARPPHASAPAPPHTHTYTHTHARARPHPPTHNTGTDISPIVPALEKIWRDSKGQVRRHPPRPSPLPSASLQHTRLRTASPYTYTH